MVLVTLYEGGNQSMPGWYVLTDQGYVLQIITATRILSEGKIVKGITYIPDGVRGNMTAVTRKGKLQFRGTFALPDESDNANQANSPTEAYRIVMKSKSDDNYRHRFSSDSSCGLKPEIKPVC